MLGVSFTRVCTSDDPIRPKMAAPMRIRRPCLYSPLFQINDNFVSFPQKRFNRDQQQLDNNTAVKVLITKKPFYPRLTISTSLCQYVHIIMFILD